MVRFDMPVQPVDAVGRTDRIGLCPAAEENKNLQFGEFPGLCPVTTSWRKASAKSPPAGRGRDSRQHSHGRQVIGQRSFTNIVSDLTYRANSRANEPVVSMAHRALRSLIFL
jgi:hypothetical protein